MLKQVIKKFMYLFLGGFKECASCNRFESCDRKPYLHRCKEDCNYGKINGK